jgi:hypothetical protein
MTSTESKEVSPHVDPPAMTVALQNLDGPQAVGRPADVAGPIGLVVDLADVLRPELGREHHAVGQAAHEVAPGRGLLGDLEPVAPTTVVAAADLDRDA